MFKISKNGGSDLQRRQFSTISCKNNGQNQKYRHPSLCIGHSKAHRVPRLSLLSMYRAIFVQNREKCAQNQQKWGSDLQRRQFSTISGKNNGQNEKYRFPDNIVL